jgi:CspA family cold shock protein
MESNGTVKLTGLEGEVKWFDPRKGFGFIVGPEGQDIFVHFSVIEGDGFRVLRDGAHVEYDAEKSAKGWRATRVTRPAEAEIGVTEQSSSYARTPRR